MESWAVVSVCEIVSAIESPVPSVGKTVVRAVIECPAHAATAALANAFAPWVAKVIAVIVKFAVAAATMWSTVLVASARVSPHAAASTWSVATEGECVSATECLGNRVERVEGGLQVGCRDRGHDALIKASCRVLEVAASGVLGVTHCDGDVETHQCANEAHASSESTVHGALLALLLIAGARCVCDEWVCAVVN